jgi:hypothetical protein
MKNGQDPKTAVGMRINIKITPVIVRLANPILLPLDNLLIAIMIIL